MSRQQQRVVVVIGLNLNVWNGQEQNRINCRIKLENDKTRDVCEEQFNYNLKKSKLTKIVQK
jgi:hypothetical protein